MKTGAVIMIFSRSFFCLSPSALLLLASAPLCLAQSSQSSPAETPAQVTAETLHAGTQLVIVDVVVEDRNGHAAHGLTRDDFVLTDQKKPQTIRNFEEHTAASDKKPGPPMPPMPPGVFSNYTPVPPDGTLNILLIDALNTPMNDQNFVRQQLLDYVKHEKPGTSVAIFGLTTRLTMLQGFTSDPAVLRAAVEHHLNSRASPMLDDAANGGDGPEKLSEFVLDVGLPGAAAVAADLKQFEAEQESLQTQTRTDYTLDAFNALAHYLLNFPGRKNLIWFSGSFPLQIEPDPTIPVTRLPWWRSPTRSFARPRVYSRWLRQRSTPWTRVA